MRQLKPNTSAGVLMGVVRCPRPSSPEPLDPQQIALPGVASQAHVRVPPPDMAATPISTL